VLCLPLFLPASLYLQRLCRVRRHDGPPRLWEVLQHWVVFSVVFELMIPAFPRFFRSTADPWDAVAYLAGGTAGWLVWSGGLRRIGLPRRSGPAAGSLLPPAADSTSARPGRIQLELWQPSRPSRI
jgi:hypothetical protein